MQHCAGFISAESLYMFRASSAHHQEYDVEWLCRNKTCTVLHKVGVSFDLYYDARKHKSKIRKIQLIADFWVRDGRGNWKWHCVGGSVLWLTTWSSATAAAAAATAATAAAAATTATAAVATAAAAAAAATAATDSLTAPWPVEKFPWFNGT